MLPAFTIAIGSIAGWSRYVRSSTIESLGQDYVRTARAKGMDEQRGAARHVLRNALIPFVTVVGIDVPLYLTGAVLVETVFSWPGMGRLFFDALTVRDYPGADGHPLAGRGPDRARQPDRGYRVRRARPTDQLRMSGGRQWRRRPS